MVLGESVQAVAGTATKRDGDLCGEVEVCGGHFGVPEWCEVELLQQRHVQQALQTGCPIEQPAER